MSFRHRRRQGRALRPAYHAQAAALLMVLALTLGLALGLAACGPSETSRAAHTMIIANQRSFTYVAIGASDAFGVGTDDPRRDNWPTVLAGLLGPGVHLVNLGIPGETVAEARQTEMPVALDARPALVTVWLGVNDIVQSVSVADFEHQLQALLTSLHQHTSAHVFVGNIPDLSLLPYFVGYDQVSLRATIASWNAAIGEAVTSSGASLVDLHGTWSELASHPEYIAGDGFHPSTVGAQRLAEVFASWIAPLLPSLRAAAGRP